jgi:hypothetical protein
MAKLRGGLTGVAAPQTIKLDGAPLAECAMDKIIRPILFL